MQTEYDFKCRCVLAMYMRATFRCWSVGVLVNLKAKAIASPYANLAKQKQIWL